MIKMTYKYITTIFCRHNVMKVVTMLFFFFLFFYFKCFILKIDIDKVKFIIYMFLATAK